MPFELSPSAIIIILIGIFVANLIAFYLISQKTNKKIQQSPRSIHFMEFVESFENDKGAFIKLQTTHPDTDETIIITHQLPQYVYQHAHDTHQAILDEYQLENDPMVEVSINFDNPENFSITDKRF